MKCSLAWVLALLLTAGCASNPGLDRQGAVVTSLDQLPPPTENAGLGSPAYRVGAFDELTITVFGVPEVSGDYVVDPEGRVSVPLAGSFAVEGMTVEEFSTQITANLVRYVRDPDVTVNIKEATSRTITVDGQVKDPGIFRATNNLTLMRAIASAKGVTDNADLEDVVVFRTVSGQQMAALYNLQAIRRGTYLDPPLYADDIVVVGDSPTSRLIRELAPVFATPVVLLAQTITR